MDAPLKIRPRLTAKLRRGPARMPTRTEASVEEVRSLILRGVLRPGTVLKQEELAAQIGVSTTPLREALRRLAADGLVTLSAHREARVARISVAQARDVFEARLPLDELAVQFAAKRYDAADKSRILALAKHLSPVVSVHPAADLRRNRELHRAIYAASHNPTLVAILDRLWDDSDRYRLINAHISLDRKPAQDHAYPEHMQLVELVLERDAEAAGGLMRKHVQSSLEWLESAVSDSSDGADACQ